MKMAEFFLQNFFKISKLGKFGQEYQKFGFSESKPKTVSPKGIQTVAFPKTNCPFFILPLLICLFANFFVETSLLVYEDVKT
jgi:hypothetical protein